MVDKGDIILPDQRDNIIRTKEANYIIHPKGIGYDIFEALNKHKKRIALIEAENGKEETFETLLKKSIRIAYHLRELNVSSNDVISPCTTNSFNSSAIFYGILFTGAKVAAMDPFAPDDDRLRQLEIAKPKFIFAIPETVEALERMIKSLGLESKIIVLGETNQHLKFEDFLIPLDLEEEKNFLPYEAKDLQETALIVFSSGTTGKPKGVCISHYSAMCIFGKGINLPPQVLLVYSTLVSASSIVQTFSSTILGGIKLQDNKFNPSKTLKYLEKYKVTLFFIAPQDVISLLKHGNPENIKLPHLFMLSPVGCALSVETILKLRKMFPTTNIYTAYAQTELWNASLVPDITPLSRELYLNKPGSCGKPVKRATYKIVDLDTGKILGPNQPGELCIKTKTTTTGYYGEEKLDNFDEDGFFKTGDIMYYDEDKWFYFVERCKEMLRYKTIPIAPTEIEGILIQHPSVKIAVVIGKNTDEGDLATAVIVKKDDNVTAEELEDLVAGKVDERKKLRGGVYFVEESEIPFTVTRKVKRRDLKKYILKKFLNQ